MRDETPKASIGWDVESGVPLPMEVGYGEGHSPLVPSSENF